MHRSRRLRLPTGRRTQAVAWIRLRDGGQSAYIGPVNRPQTPADDLDPRARQLLRTLIARHIRDGEPVGSQTLVRKAGLDISAATVRNILADLEEAGFLSSPHTSAGRVPTTQGYRLFVDSLLQVKPLPEPERVQLRHGIGAATGTRSALGSTSELLSAMTHFVGVVSAPKRGQRAVRHLDFVALDDQRVLAVLVYADHEVQNRIIQTRHTYDRTELERIANFLNQHFAGLPLADIRMGMLRELRHARNEMEQAMARTVALAEQALDGADDDAPEAILMAGQNRLIGVQDLADLDRLRDLFDAFASKREILQLLERTIHAPGVRIFIGEETGLAPLDGVSLVTAPYTAEGKVLGVLGVIGPTRMAYDRVIPVVQAAADVLGAALEPGKP